LQIAFDKTAQERSEILKFRALVQTRRNLKFLNPYARSINWNFKIFSKRRILKASKIKSVPRYRISR